MKKIVLKDALFVPDNSKNLISVSKLREAGVDVSFGEKLEFVFNKVSFPFEVENGLFVWEIFLVLMKIALMLTVYKCGMQRWDITIFLI